MLHFHITELDRRPDREPGGPPTATDAGTLVGDTPGTHVTATGDATIRPLVEAGPATLGTLAVCTLRGPSTPEAPDAGTDAPGASTAGTLAHGTVTLGTAAHGTAEGTGPAWPGGTAAGAEWAAVPLDGPLLDRPATPDGTAEHLTPPRRAVYAPPGVGRRLRAVDGPVTALLIAGRSPDSATRVDGTPAVASANGASPPADDAAALAAAGGITDMHVDWLVTTASHGSCELAVACSAFTADGTHDLHRHPHADEFFLVLEGGGEHLTESGPVPLGPGDLVYVAAGEWHGFRTTPGLTTRTVYGYLGAGSLADAGYELRTADGETADVGDAGRATRRQSERSSR